MGRAFKEDERPTSNEKTNIHYRTFITCFRFFIFIPSTFDFHAYLDHPFFRFICLLRQLFPNSTFDVGRSMFDVPFYSSWKVDFSCTDY